MSKYMVSKTSYVYARSLWALVYPTYRVHFIVAWAPMFHQVINLSCKNAYDMHILYVPLTAIIFFTQT